MSSQFWSRISIRSWGYVFVQSCCLAWGCVHFPGSSGLSVFPLEYSRGWAWPHSPCLLLEWEGRELPKHIPKTCSSVIGRERGLKNHTKSFVCMVIAGWESTSKNVANENKKCSDKKLCSHDGNYWGFLWSIWWLANPLTWEYQEILTVSIYTYAMIVISIGISRLLLSGWMSLCRAQQCRGTQAAGDWLPGSKKSAGNWNRVEHWLCGQIVSVPGFCR